MDVCGGLPRTGNSACIQRENLGSEWEGNLLFSVCPFILFGGKKKKFFYHGHVLALSMHT